MRKPSIGDIWYNHLGNIYYLVLQDDYPMGADTGYTVLLLETGRLDYARKAHFDAQCRYIS